MINNWQRSLSLISYRSFTFRLSLKKLKTSLSFLTIAWLCLILPRQQLFAKESGEELFFSTLSVNDGLPSNIMAGIAQDQYDFIWVATGSGLARYDGYTFETFKKAEHENSLPSNDLTAIVAHGDYIWVGSWGGFCKIHIKTFKVTRIDLGINTAVRTLYLAGDNKIWIGTADGLIVYHTETGAIQRYNSKEHGLSHDMVRSIYQDDDKTLWVGTFDGLNKLKFGSNQFERIPLRTAANWIIKNHLILDIKPSSADSKLWIGTETGLYRVHKSNGTSEPIKSAKGGFSNEVIKCIYANHSNQLWLGTDFGLNIFDIGTKESQSQFHNPQRPYSITNNVIWQIFEDRGGILWFCTSNGLSRLNQYNNFFTFHEVSQKRANNVIGNQIRSFLIDSNGNHWLATQNGVIRIDGKTQAQTLFNTGAPEQYRILLDNVYTLIEDDLGRIWIGSAGGINIWNPVQKTMKAITSTETNGLTSNYIAKFSKQEDGTLWVSAWQGGLFKIVGNLDIPEQITFQSVPSFSGSESHVSGRDFIWVIENDILYQVDHRSLETRSIDEIEKLTQTKSLHTLFYASNEQLWVSTDGGLIRWDTKNQKAYDHSIRDGQSTITTSIIEDDSGDIWSIANTSLQKFDKEGHHLEVFPLDKNLPINNFYIGCAAKTVSGDLIFGGDNGYIQFDPAQASLNTYEPKIYITEIEINNNKIAIDEVVNDRILLQQNVSFENGLVLDYQERSVTFRFSSLDYSQAETNFYAYKLDGFDKEWTHVSGSTNFAIYSNLESGEYTFRVKTTKQNTQSNNAEATFSFVVNPPLYLSTGFILAYIVIAILVTYYSLKTYSARVKLKNELQISRLERAHAEELDQTKERFFTNISHELRTPISLILPPIQEIQKKGNLDQMSKNLISLAERNSIRLLKLVNQILDFNKIENDTLSIKVTQLELVGYCEDVFSLFTDQAQRHQIQFAIDKQIEHQEVWVDAEKIETILFNLLSNAFKFTPDQGAITLKLLLEENSTDFEQGAFVIQVSDSGVGIKSEEQSKIFERFYQAEEGKNKDASSGIGLTLAAEYVELHHGAIEVTSQPQIGTTFTVKLPLGNKHFPIDSLKTQKDIGLLARRSVHGRLGGSKYYQLDLASEKPMVLIIEDNNDIVEFIRESLGHKYNFVTAENGAEGLKRANNFMPQVIISDIMMPVMDGITLCKEIKSNPKTSHVSVILLTAKSLTANKVEGIKIGADVYLTKPFEVELLEAHIDHLIARNEELKSYFRDELIQIPEGSDEANNEDHIFVKRVMDIIQANISNSELTVELISDEMAMSSTHLYRRLKATTNHSAKEIIQKYRLKKASLLLQNKEGNITEIMYQTGFSSLSYFSKCFKAEYKMSPKKYQQEHQKTTTDIG